MQVSFILEDVMGSPEHLNHIISLREGLRFIGIILGKGGVRLNSQNIERQVAKIIVKDT
jgi:hypothetical protein